MKLPVAIIAFFGILIAISGCLQQIGGGTGYRDAYITDLNPVAISDPSYFGECKLGTCWCMICENGTSLFGPMKNLIGGSCSWVKNCTATAYRDINNKTKNPNISTRQFMLGQGPTFNDFANANRYCGDQLKMAVQWLPAIGSATYLEPDTLRTMCMLSKEVMPVYILYSGGKNINATQASRIGQQMATEGDDYFLGRLSDGPVGPVIIIVEPDINQSKVGQVAAAVNALDAACNPNRDVGNITCFIAVSPKINDFATMDAFMSRSDMQRSVDLIAFGINGSSVHTCDPANIRTQALNFSKYALYNWSKPTIIPYVLFDVGTKDVDQSCDWTEARVAQAYASFFPSGIQAMKSRGVIGIAPYSYNVSTRLPILNPLNCSDCGVGSNENRLTAWYGGCEAYAIQRTASGDISRTGGSPILFPNASGGSCPQGANLDYFFNMAFRDQNFMQPGLAETPEPVEKYFSCDACLIQNSSRPIEDIFEFSVGEHASVSQSDCDAFPDLIDSWAGARGLDPTLVRAIIKGESNFKECEASRSCRDGYNSAGDGVEPGCFPTGEGYGKSLDAMYDAPEGACPDFQNSGANPPDWRWVAFGIMQSLEPPYTFWPASVSPTGDDGIHYDVFETSGRNTPSFISGELTWAKDCNPTNFNPFNPSDSMCIGTLKFQKMVDAATSEVATYHDQGRLNWDRSDEEKDRVFATYVALHKYGGFWDLHGSTRCDGATTQLYPGCDSTDPNGECFTKAFKDSWKHNDSWCQDDANEDDSMYETICDGDEARQDPPPFPSSQDAPCPPAGKYYYCYGYTDFVKFMHDCMVPFLPRKTDPGANKINIYIALTDTCDTFCPEGESLMDSLGVAMPSSGTAYLPDSLTTTTTTTK